jgi:uncharacterized protein YqeY
MSIYDKVGEDIKLAMKARDHDRLDALRAIKKELLEARTAKKAGGVVSNADELKILQKMVKQCKDAADIFNAQGRADLGDPELKQAGIISEYLPAMMTSEEIVEAVKEIIASTGASSMKEMGKVMGVASAALAGKAEGKEISRVVKELLSV